MRLHRCPWCGYTHNQDTWVGADRDRLEAEVKQLKADILDMELSLKHRMVYCPTCDQGAVGLYKGECFPCAAARAYRNGHYTGQAAMRERCAARVDRAANDACECDGTLCGPGDVAPYDEDCRRFDLDDLADAIRALEVER